MEHKLILDVPRESKDCIGIISKKRLPRNGTEDFIGQNKVHQEVTSSRVSSDPLAATIAKQGVDQRSEFNQDCILHWNVTKLVF